jgi:type VII secretion protein EccB
MAGYRLTTKVQVSGWRFLLRRVEHAIVRRDTAMFDDPLQFYGRSVAAGMVVAALVAAGALLLAYFKPLGHRGGDNVLVDRTTNQLYVLLPGSGQLHPAYNLTSARLVLGHPSNPAAVKSDELSRLPKGQPIGIPGAPYATPVSATSASAWALCDTVIRPDSVTPTVETSILAVPLVTDAAVAPLGADEGVVVSYADTRWLVTRDGRHAVDLADRAVSSAVGIPVTVKPAPISRGLFNALPDTGPWQLTPIPNAGAPNTVGLADNLVIGSTFQTLTDKGNQSYVVLPNGVARVNATTAAALRATNSYGLLTPPMVEASTVARIPEQVYHSPLPDNAMTIVNPVDEPTLCWSWQRQAGDQSPQHTIIRGRHLPLPAPVLATGIRQIGAEATVYIDGGRFVRVASPDPRYGESRYYVDPEGVRYGVPDEDTSRSLGLADPSNAPWQVLGLLIDGPVLTKQAALLEHDTLPADPDPRRVATDPGNGR